MKPTIGMRDDKFKVFHLCEVKTLSIEEVLKIRNLRRHCDYVYEIEKKVMFLILVFH